MVSARSIALKLEFHLFKKERAWLRGLVSAKSQAALRRNIRAKYLVWGAKDYHAWLNLQLPQRQTRYACQPEHGLLSVLTPVWDGTPVNYFRLLADSIISQNQSGATEWVILNNGCQRPEMLDFLATLQRYPWVTTPASTYNAGIIGGLHLCLEAARGRYVLPVDSDDWLYPDCLQIVSWWIRHHGFPALLYSDEDKVIGKMAVQPYLKPDFDPVLLLNSAYIAHLGVIDRRLALKYGAYTDQSTEGSPDWDLFIRFFLAGERTAHIPEVIYGWRMHPESTADDADSKPYIHSSQKAVLQRYLDATGLAGKYDIEYSPLLNGSADWWLHRRQLDPWPAVLVSMQTGATTGPQRLDYRGLQQFSVSAKTTLTELVRSVSATSLSGDALICLVQDDLQIDRSDWIWEAIGLFERYRDAVMVGGRVRNSAGAIMAAGYVLGFGGVYHCPDFGRPALDPGYFTQMLKQRSVSAVSSQFAVLRAGFLFELANDSPSIASLPLLGAWAGAYALRTGKRIIYSPYLSGVANLYWDALSPSVEITEFQRRNRDLMPDSRFYPPALSTEPGRSYRLAME